jgi:hypothetical protein
MKKTNPWHRPRAAADAAGHGAVRRDAAGGLLLAHSNTLREIGDRHDRLCVGRDAPGAFCYVFLTFIPISAGMDQTRPFSRCKCQGKNPLFIYHKTKNPQADNRKEQGPAENRINSRPPMLGAGGFFN